MSEAVRVYVVEFGDRRHYQMQYVDPLTRKKVTRSTGVERTGRKRERALAEKAAGQWEAELREGRYHAPSRMTWEAFRERYEAEVLPGLALATSRKIDGVFNVLERVLAPVGLRDIDEQAISRYTAELRKGGRSEDTIMGHLAHIAAALRWAERVGLLAKAPKVDRPRRAKGAKTMKGRPITTEEFERMLAATSAVVGDAAAESWRHLLRGLWWSGLRLSESLELYWDRHDKLCVDLTSDLPMLWIPAAEEKGNRDRLLPMAPEFANFLQETPEEARTGRVFQPLLMRFPSATVLPTRAMLLISRIGKAAHVKVAIDASGKPKYASAHDLRRSFAERWSGKVMPTDLMVLMRHESISTTMKYYVGRNAQKTAQALWSAIGNTLGNTCQNAPLATGTKKQPKSLAYKE